MNHVGAYNADSQIKIKTWMLRSRSCDYSDAYILVNETITASALAPGGGNNGIQVVHKINSKQYTNR